MDHELLPNYDSLCNFFLLLIIFFAFVLHVYTNFYKYIPESLCTF